jgi:hypothetical protein
MWRGQLRTARIAKPSSGLVHAIVDDDATSLDVHDSAVRASEGKVFATIGS